MFACFCSTIRHKAQLLEFYTVTFVQIRCPAGVSGVEGGGGSMNVARRSDLRRVYGDWQSADQESTILEGFGARSGYCKRSDILLSAHGDWLVGSYLSWGSCRTPRKLLLQPDNQAVGTAVLRQTRQK